VARRNSVVVDRVDDPGYGLSRRRQATQKHSYAGY